MIGNHRDAWTWGAVDPNSGTSVMLEVSRVLMQLKKSNLWRPKRTILFLSWDAEEFGVVGSTEWVEEFQKKLSANGVVYINIDNIIKGELGLIVCFE
jgi:N-acetylated-alpha-linked acidic dipeptidase